MTPDSISKLGLYTWKTNIGAQKINGSALKIYQMAIVAFSI